MESVNASLQQTKAVLAEDGTINLPTRVDALELAPQRCPASVGSNNTAARPLPPQAVGSTCRTITRLYNRELPAAIKLLRELKSPQRLQEFVRQGVVGALLQALGKPELPYHAAAAVVNLSVDDANKTAIADAGGIETLASWLDPPDMSAQAACLTALHNLSVTSAGAARCLEADALPNLVVLSLIPQFTVGAHRVLCNLTSDERFFTLLSDNDLRTVIGGALQVLGPRQVWSAEDAEDAAVTAELLRRLRQRSGFQQYFLQGSCAPLRRFLDALVSLHRTAAKMPGPDSVNLSVNTHKKSLWKNYSCVRSALDDIVSSLCTDNGIRVRVADHPDMPRCIVDRLRQAHDENETIRAENFFATVAVTAEHKQKVLGRYPAEAMVGLLKGRRRPDVTLAVLQALRHSLDGSMSAPNCSRKLVYFLRPEVPDATARAAAETLSVLRGRNPEHRAAVDALLLKKERQQRYYELIADSSASR